jgi:thiol-disulfide isomerase/thioredoxin
MRRAAVVALSVAATLLLAGCSSTDTLAVDFGSGSGTSYTDDSGAPVIVKASDRAKAITFTSKDEAGKPVSMADYLGRVVVVNFWYAGCAPCRAEAPILNSLQAKYAQDGVAFLGVNTVDQAATALSFKDQFTVLYPSAMDVDSGSARIAFAGAIAPTATPTTYVIDTKGRIAARIVGQLESASILNTLISDALAESK